MDITVFFKVPENATCSIRQWAWISNQLYLHCSVLVSSREMQNWAWFNEHYKLLPSQSN